MDNTGSTLRKPEEIPKLRKTTADSSSRPSTSNSVEVESGILDVVEWGIILGVIALCSVIAFSIFVTYHDIQLKYREVEIEAELRVLDIQLKYREVEIEAELRVLEEETRQMRISLEKFQRTCESVDMWSPVAAIHAMGHALTGIARTLVSSDKEERPGIEGTRKLLN